MNLEEILNTQSSIIVSHSQKSQISCYPNLSLWGENSMDSAANQCAILDAENAMTENRHGGAKDDGNANKIVQIRRPSQVVMG